MFNIVALGGEEFTLGFRLSGILAIKATEDVEADFEKLIAKEEIGIIITDEKTMSRLPEHARERIEGLVRPVTVVLSTDAAGQDTLRKKIIKSIGVDLWKD